ncbi:MAG: hypothetical protein H7301_01960 [Cryobacterium sp.]|nr:hypothetical protein [Oligoflexia bacterium]
MQRQLFLGMALILSSTACAPVASSVPKLAAQPRVSDAVVENGIYGLGVDSEVIVKGTDEYDAYEKSLASDYELLKFTDREPELSEFRDSRTIAEITLPARLKRVDFVVILVLKKTAKEKPSDFKLEWLRGERNRFSLSLPKDGVTDVAWTSLKKNLGQITIAYRAKKLQTQ